MEKVSSAISSIKKEAIEVLDEVGMLEIIDMLKTFKGVYEGQYL